jgi:hypothetical protein
MLKVLLNSKGCRLPVVTSMTGLSHRFPWYIEALQTQLLLDYCLSRLVRLPTFQSGLDLLNAEQECS